LGAAARVSAFLFAAATRSLTVAGPGGTGLDGRAGFLTLDLVRAANGAVTLAATDGANPGEGADATWAGYGGACC
jgi:hypothetical protein